MGDHDNGQRMPIMGDRHPNRFNSQSTETNTATSANAATQVQTVADLEPTEPVKVEEERPVEAKTEEIKTEEVPEIAKEVEPEAPVAPLESELVAHFVSDAVQDGTILAPNLVFEQTWILRNGGEKPWPAGCTVKFVGGDNMCAVDPDHPASVHELVSAAESTTCYTEVAPGQDYPFTVLMRTPNRAGKVISYWRLTGPNGYKFGHRLWCDVVVKEPTPVVKEEEVKEEVKEEIKEEVQPEVKEVEKSQMIFPKLDKESPIASVHEETASTEIPVLAENDEFQDLIEEDHDLLEDDITEDGFLTDEEYDILDASDEEYLADQAKAAKK
jgi:next-to-BRCA1 protein 1